MTANRQYIIGAIIFVTFVGFLFAISGKKQPPKQVGQMAITPDPNAQMITVTAKGGYFPAQLTAKADMPTTLRITTNNTFDCSAALTIPSLGVRRMLPPNGNTDIPIPPQESGTRLSGTCSMGMYGFDVEFQ